MNASVEIAEMLQRRLVGMGFDVRQIEQIDFVSCEDGKSIMAYAYDAGDDCLALCFDRPAMFDPAEVEAEMIYGDLALMTLH